MYRTIGVAGDPHVPDTLKLPRVGRRVEHIHTSRVFGRVSVLTDQSVKLRTNDVWNGTHPFARMTQSPEGNWEFRWSSQTSRLGSYSFTEDSGNTAQCFPLPGEVISIPLVHDPITVTHELFERIRVEELNTTSGVVEPEDFTESEALLPKERFLLMQSTAYVTNSYGIGIPLGCACDRHNVISTDDGIRAKNLTRPAVKDTENREREGRAHKATPSHMNSNRFYLRILNPGQREHLKPVFFGEIRPAVLNIMPRVADAQGLGSNAQQTLGKACLTKTAENSPDSIMRETVGRLRQIGTKIVLITAQDPRKAFHCAVRTDSLTEIENPLVNLPKTREQCLSGYSTCSKNTGWRDGNDTHLASLLRDWCRDVHRHVLKVHSGLAEFLHRQQGSVTLQEFGVLKFIERTAANHFEQPVKKTILTWEVGATSRRFEDTTLRLRPVKIAVQVTRDQRPQVFVVAPLRARCLLNRVLRRRGVFPNTISQLTFEPHQDILFDTVADKRPCMYWFRDITGVGQKPRRGASSRRHRKSTSTPCEGKDAPGLGGRQTSKPPLRRPGNLLYETDFPLRKANVTEGHAQVLQLVRQPVSSSRAGSSYPLPDFPAATLLRYSRGHETSPHSPQHAFQTIGQPHPPPTKQKKQRYRK
jgi:hypothetical protein